MDKKNVNLKSTQEFKTPNIQVQVCTAKRAATPLVSDLQIEDDFKASIISSDENLYSPIMAYTNSFNGTFHAVKQEDISTKQP